MTSQLAVEQVRSGEGPRAATAASRLTSEGLCLDEYASNETYAAVHFKRAVGELPEMECSKAMAQLVAERIRANSVILDAGCGAGHYLRSFKKALSSPFQYVGVDYFSLYLDKAAQAWKDEPRASFRQGSIFDLPVSDGEFDVVTCSNLIMHLPSIVKPVHELMRASRKWVLIRTPIGSPSFRIQEVLASNWWSCTGVAPEQEFDDEGRPRSFSYKNIYSKEYFSGVIRRHAPEARITYIKDDQFRAENIEKSADTEGLPNATRVLDGMQVFGYIILPYSFVVIELPD